LLGTSTSYIILPPPKISVGCGPVLIYLAAFPDWLQLWLT